MPIKPVTRMEPLPVETPQDVAALVDLLVPGDENDDLSRGLGDHFSYLAATHPQWFTPYRELVLTERLRSFNGNFGDFCILFGGAPDHCVEYLLGKRRDGWSIWPGWALASIGTESAMTAVADWVRAGGDRSGRDGGQPGGPVAVAGRPGSRPQQGHLALRVAARRPGARHAGLAGRAARSPGTTCRCASTRCPACRPGRSSGYTWSGRGPTGTGR